MVLMNAVPKMVTPFDRFCNGFPAPVKDTVTTFFDRDPSEHTEKGHKNCRLTHGIVAYG